MLLIQRSLANPISVFVGLLLIFLFGFISLNYLPIQLTPEVQDPEITISTTWRAAAPNEIEAEIIEPQEEVLRGLPGMIELRSRAQEGRAVINLTFAVDINLERALIEIINRLNQVSGYPVDADEPTIDTVGADAQPIAWFVIKPAPGNVRDIVSYSDFIEDVVQARFEQIKGVARSDIYGATEREVRITFDPYKVANLGIQLPKIIQRGVAKDVSAGTWDVGKREYKLRFSGKYQLDELGGMILEWRDGHPIYLRDVAVIAEHLSDRQGFVLTKGSPSIAVNAQREAGVNVLKIMADIQAAYKELNAGPLAREHLVMEQVYDETIYIRRSIEMLRNNIGFGILLSITVLWCFLLRFRATLIVAISVPICILMSFSVMYLTSRTINVISLAGLALATGMVLDASIIVLENIVRLREQGLAKREASVQGVAQIWGALFASTITTIAIFLPIVFLRDEVGQLFADLAITITSAIGMSLLSAIIVVPTAAYLYMRNTRTIDPYNNLWQRLTALIIALTDTPLRRALCIFILICLPILSSYFLRPQMDYLPDGNRNMVVSFMVPPPGSNIDDLEREMGQVIVEKLAPHMDGRAQPGVKHYFFVAGTRGVFLGMRAMQDSEASALVPLVNSIVQGFPDTIGFARQASLFLGFGEGRSIDINIQGRDLEIIMDTALQTFVRLPQHIQGVNVRPKPGLILADPELRLLPNERRLAEAGLERTSIAALIRAFGDGLFLGDYFNGEKTLDVILRAKPWQQLDELLSFPLATPNAGVMPLGELVTAKYTAGPEEILRINRRRTVTLEVSPPPTLSLEATLAIIKTEIAPQLLDMLPADGVIQYAGTVDKLRLAIQNMAGSFILAIVILYLLMSAIFASFRDSLLVILSIPLATIGGVLALAILNLFIVQNMDLLTMIGFVILLGLVVNNAILLVHQARLGERQGLVRREAVAQAIRLRLRPIFMSTLTSIFGTLPLLLNPGAGTELYRGLAAVIVGGMSVSTIFTLLLLPSMLRIGEKRHA